MARRFSLLWAGVALVAPVSAGADPLTVDKSASVVADAVNALNPRILPGSTLDITLLVTNPAGNLLKPVRQVVVSDPIPVTMKLRLRDPAVANSEPVAFADGTLLGLGLTATDLTYSFGGLASASDSLEFSDGTSWTYVPVPDAAGYDGNVREIRVTLAGTHRTGTRFRLRYRVAVR